MSCANNNFIKDIRQGDTFTGLKMTLYDGVGEDKTPMDLTGYTINIPFKKGAGQNNAFLFSTEDNTITIPTPTNGEIFLMPRDMNYPAFNYIFSLEIITETNTKITYFTNFWQITQDV
ncbi:hypothetical protein [Flavobacterium sp.]|jgi:hypothetical protein|uniref:hypothetical protein n=1 Tax=Flavobacterium sp. TaxID=239 RepID=UPI0037C041FF